MTRSPALLLCLILVGGACSDAAVAPVPSPSPATTAASSVGDPPPITAPTTAVTENPTTTVAAAADTRSGAEILLVAGSIEVPAAGGFDDPGFHAPFALSGVVPAAADGVTGRLIVRLRDTGRPDQTCDAEHPLSGCVTVDWSDFENRPSVPAGGVFDNRLRVTTTSGTRDFFLSENRGLADTPDQYSPT